MNRFIVTAGLVIAGQLHAQGFDQRAVGRAVLRELIETNTTASTGSTTKAAELLAARFRAAGVPAADIAIVGPDEPHQSLVVRIRGASGAQKPILLLAHLDVVEAERRDWTMDPFTLNEKGGFYYGRGTQDVKGGAATLVTSLLRLRAEGVTPARDLILALTSGEEGACGADPPYRDGCGMPNGVQWLLAHRKDLVDAEYCINTDGGGIDSENGKPVVMNMQAAEKVYFDVRLTVTNKGGHSSLPRPDNAINVLAHALTKIEAYRFPVEFNEITRAYMARTAPLRTGQLGADLKAAPAGDKSAIARLARDPWFNAQMRTTCIATMLNGGHAPNALPQTATANVNCRRLPGLGGDSLVKILARIIGDTTVKLTMLVDSPQSPPSPLRKDVEAAVRLASAAVAPNLPLVPTMETGATDGLFMRNAGIPTYGLSGLAIDVDDVRAHGRDERLGVESFERGLEFMYRLVKAVASPIAP